MRPSNPNTSYGETGSPTGKLAWSLLLAAAAAAALVAAAGMVITFATSDAALRAVAAMVPAGLLCLRCLVVYGVGQRGRWALWTGALLGLLSLPAPLLAGISVEAPAVKLELTGVSMVLAWLNAATGLLFLVGLALLFWSRRR